MSGYPPRCSKHNADEWPLCADCIREPLEASLAECQQRLSEMTAALRELMKETNTIEVLGEWEATDANYSLRKQYRTHVNALMARCIKLLESELQKAKG